MSLKPFKGRQCFKTATQLKIMFEGGSVGVVIGLLFLLGNSEMKPLAQTESV